MNFSFHKLYVLIFAGLLFSQCEDYLGGDLNRDPNNPVAVTVGGQLPAILLTTMDTYGGLSEFECMLVQQVEGVARQWSSFNQYTGLTPNRFDGLWNNIYNSILNEINLARPQALEQDLYHYQAVLNTIEALALMMATDIWDDIPFSEAFQGFDNPNPKFDSQESIYNVILNDLNQAISLFDGPGGIITPSAKEDVFYDGDAELWKKAANAIKARALLHLGEYEQASEAAQMSFESAEDNMSYLYPDENSPGTWYRFNTGRQGDIEFHPTLRGIMTDLNDTFRLAEIDQTFDENHTYLTAEFLQEITTYREMQFIIAEASVRATDGGTQEGYDAYLNGIKASFDRLDLDDEAYEEYISFPEVNPGVGNLTLEQVLTQKYIALFLDPEAYNDYRRTNIPNLEPVSGSNVPVRLHYSSNEYLFNTNSPSEGDINIYEDRVWWDKE